MAFKSPIVSIDEHGNHILHISIKDASTKLNIPITSISSGKRAYGYKFICAYKYQETNYYDKLNNMKSKLLKQVDLTSLEVDGIDKRDYPEFCDAYFSAGCKNNGVELTEDELDKLAELIPEVLNEMAYNSLF